jgi:dienelactone hydrolase
VKLALMSLALLACSPPPTARRPLTEAADALAAHRARLLDAYLDGRWTGIPSTADTLDALAIEAPAELERLLRAGRSYYGPPPQPPGQIALDVPIDCEHVDYQTTYDLYVPRTYDAARAWPLIIVGHGGNGAMPRQYAVRTAQRYLDFYLPRLAEKAGMIMVVPVSERGWMSIGNSLILSVISRLSRDYHLDPDRIYLTGHSMGGHLAWRSALALGDRFGAVAPMSGGYSSYIDSGDIINLASVPGYATFGVEEPYGIDVTNRLLGAWLGAHGYPWKVVQKNGGHQIYADELPRVYDFFRDHPRDLYRSEVWVRRGAGVDEADPGQNPDWGITHTWRAGRAIHKGFQHWIRLYDLPPGQPGPQTLHARIIDRGHIEIESSGVRHLRIYLHPRMVSFEGKLSIVVNGKVLFSGQVEPSLATMLATVRETDDRGRIFWAAVDLDVTSDAAPVPMPAEVGG